MARKAEGELQVEAEPVAGRGCSRRWQNDVQVGPKREHGGGAAVRARRSAGGFGIQAVQERLAAGGPKRTREWKWSRR